MALLQSIVLRNYRRFRGEIEVPLSAGIDLICAPPGGGKSSLAEAVAWCLVGRSGAAASEVVNTDALAEGDPDVLVTLTFQAGGEVALERSLTAVAGVGLKERTAVRAEGKEEDDLAAWREELFPAACIDSNIISGAAIVRSLQGERTGTERAVEAMSEWAFGEAYMRSSLEATSLFLAMVPDAAVSCLLFDERGRPVVQCYAPERLGPAEHHLLLLASALAFARESCPAVPVILDEPFEGLDEVTAERAVEAVTEFMAGRQLILLLSKPAEVAAVRATGRVDKELEIRG